MIETGLHDLPVEEYHADPCPEPSLSSSIVRALLDETPAHARARHPRLTQWPDHCETPTKEQDLGTIVHSLVLGKGHEVVVFREWDNWRKKEAQEARDATRAEGKIPCLAPLYDQAVTVAEHARAQLASHFGVWPIGSADLSIRPEITAIWRRRTSRGGVDAREIWCRGLLDFWSYEQATIGDLKTTSKSTSNAELAKKFAGDGADIQAAWYLSGIASLFPELAGRLQFLFVVVEVEPPYSTRIVQLAESWRHLASLRLDRATDTWADCLDSGVWPEWSPYAELEAPAWRTSQFETAEVLESLP